MTTELTTLEREILSFAGWQFRYPGAQAEAISILFGFSPTTYWRKVNDLLDNPAALAYAPATVNRLRRLRERRVSRRLAA